MDFRKASPVVLAVLLTASLSFIVGLYIGREHAWSYLDYATVERRMREVFCESAMKNGLLKKCDPTFARSYQL